MNKGKTMNDEYFISYSEMVNLTNSVQRDVLDTF